MDVQAYDDPQTFRAASGDLYTADPVRHTLAVTVMHRNLDTHTPTPVMITVHRDGAPHGAAFRTPPWPLIVSGLPADAAPAAAAALAELDPELPGANGPRELAEAFAEAWASHTGAAANEVMASRLYRLGELRPPTVPGRARRADESDLPLLTRWRREFEEAALGHLRPTTATGDVVRRGLALGDGIILWEHDGRPVSWATVGLPVHGMSRLAPVYTPAELRGHGYGSAATAAASGWALDAGAEHVLLFADLANPTANSIYRKIGYLPVFDTVEIELTAST